MSGEVGGTTSGDDRMDDTAFAALLEEAEQYIKRHLSGEAVSWDKDAWRWFGGLVEAARARESARAAALASAPEVLRHEVERLRDIRSRIIAQGESPWALAFADAIEALLADHELAR